MKRKILIILLALATVFCCAFGLAACDDNSNSGNNSGSGNQTEQGGNGGNNSQTHEHSYSESIVAPTCTEQGYTLHKCECGVEYKDNYINALGHDIVHHESQAATCTKSGWADYDACTRCNYSTYSELKPNGHSYENRICTICGQKEPSTLLEYTLSGTNYTVTGIGTETDTEIVIASEYNGKPVKSIGDKAFSNCSGLTSVTIGKSVTTIGNWAFLGCSGLTSICITDLAAWSNISFGSFTANPLYYAHNLYLNGELITELTIPDSVTKIGNYVFYYCIGLKSITIPDSVTSIGNYVFCYCSGLNIYFGGTKAQWNAVTKGTEWNYNTGSYTIYCTDGTISK